MLKEKKKHILLLCKTKLHRDPRVLKQIEALANDYIISCVGIEKSGKSSVHHDYDLFHAEVKNNVFQRLSISLQLITKQYKSIYWTSNHKDVYRFLSKNKYDLIICNELESLPIADKLAKQQNIPIYCDLHEYYTIDKKNGRFSKHQKLYEEWSLINHISKVQKFTTVSPQIVNLYLDNYHIHCDLLNNASKYYDLQATVPSTDTIALISHGAAISSRKIETLIFAVNSLSENYTLDLFLANNDDQYLNYLHKIVAELDTKRIKIYPAIAFDNIQKTINKYDIGIYSLYPTHLNNKYALPNKLFEFIQGRVALAIGPTPAMAEIVNRYQIGVVADDFTADELAKAIQNISAEDLLRYKENTNAAALTLNSAQNIKQIQKIVRQLLA